MRDLCTDQDAEKQEEIKETPNVPETTGKIFEKGYGVAKVYKPVLVFKNFHLAMDYALRAHKFFSPHYQKSINKMKNHYEQKLSEANMQFDYETQVFLYHTRILDDFVEKHKEMDWYKDFNFYAKQAPFEDRERGGVYRHTEKGGNIVHNLERSLETSDTMLFIERKIREKAEEKEWAQVLEIKELENKYLVVLEHLNELSRRVIATGRRYFGFIVKLMTELQNSEVFAEDTDIGKSLTYLGLDFDRKEFPPIWTAFSPAIQLYVRQRNTPVHDTRRVLHIPVWDGKSELPETRLYGAIPDKNADLAPLVALTEFSLFRSKYKYLN